VRKEKKKGSPGQKGFEQSSLLERRKKPNVEKKKGLQKEDSFWGGCVRGDDSCRGNGKEGTSGQNKRKIAEGGHSETYGPLKKETSERNT